MFQAQNTNHNKKMINKSKKQNVKNKFHHSVKSESANNIKGCSGD
ncbi:hypothetical protein SALWKB2_0199 [Snodgrassella alvi wkB2]|nr:hypothetical protein SALWKB2_0199 [Snodgrassella alvi wkB2]